MSGETFALAVRCIQVGDRRLPGAAIGAVVRGLEPETEVYGTASAAFQRGQRCVVSEDPHVACEMGEDQRVQCPEQRPAPPDQALSPADERLVQEDEQDVQGSYRPAPPLQQP